MSDRTWRNRIFTALGAALLLALPVRAWSQDSLGSRVNGLMAFDFSGDYITPRGLHVEGDGVVAQPLVLVFWKLHASDSGALRDATLTTGIWNSFHSHRAGFKPSRWNEVDPILSLGLKFKGGWAFDASSTAFYTPTSNYATSTHMDLKLTYNDSFIPGLAINPYVDYWVELNNKATVVFNRGTSHEGSYLTLGATPTMAIGGSGATLEVATFANFVTADFYQQFDGSDGGSGLAVFSVGPRLNVPLRFLGVTHGAWTGYLGATYYNLRNDGLLDGNRLLRGRGDAESNLTKVRAGLSVFF